MHPWQYNNKAYHNNIVSIRRVAAEVSGVDDGVGTVMDTLAKHGFDEDTIVVFAGDQGWMGGQNGFFGMGDHTRPIAAHDLMMQIPLIVRHPKKIKPGKSNIMVSNYDFMPSLLDHMELKETYSHEAQASRSQFCSCLARRNDRLENGDVLRNGKLPFRSH